MPRISVQAFCESVDAAGAVQGAAEDRRMAKAHVRIQMGGMPAALEAYRASPTPNVISDRDPRKRATICSMRSTNWQMSATPKRVSSSLVG